MIFSAIVNYIISQNIILELIFIMFLNEIYLNIDLLKNRH
ncbi:unnamed protein product [marine sediment metagenome]|uniref:Uncharacterized protein n=1 Tax=marine sediment metagenome TaxID=412755 RepID=X1GVU3_9ZZZZ